MKYWDALVTITIDKAKSRDTGLALVLIFLLLGLFLAGGMFLNLAIAALVVTMIVPGIFKPLAYVWFGLAHVLGTIFSKVLLFLVFILLVLPVGLMRGILGKDSLALKQWKKGSHSVFLTRDHLFTASDIDKPY